jgi:hypothetical protein
LTLTAISATRTGAIGAPLNKKEAAESCCEVAGQEYCPCRGAFRQGKVPEGWAACCIIQGRQYCPCRKAWDRILPPWE